MTAVRERLFDAAERESLPLTMTNGRMLSHYLTGVQTRRSPSLLAREVENVMEIHPETARRHRVEDGEQVRLTSRRGSAIVRCRVTPNIREDTVFVTEALVRRAKCKQNDQSFARSGLQDAGLQDVRGSDLRVGGGIAFHVIFTRSSSNLHESFRQKCYCFDYS